MTEEVPTEETSAEEAAPETPGLAPGMAYSYTLIL
jgi:hypothetical protein